jgi:thiamine-monophosphate kinase
MRLRSLRERELVASIRQEFAQAKRGLVLGIGDDAAVVRVGRTNILITTDLLIEDIHFTAAIQPPFLLGRKSLNVNLSDIAAMGGLPRFALLGLGIRAGLRRAWVAEFFAGFKAAAEESGVALIGGDISGSKKVCVSVTIIGEGKHFIRRSGARQGDYIFVSGYLGQAAAGLRLLKKGLRLGKNRKADVLLQAFLDPVPRLALGRTLAAKKYASAMIDTSDGLSVDLLHLCEESRTGAVVHLERLPLSPETRLFGADPEDLALHGGEDYQLLFTVSPGRLAGVLRLQKTHGLHWIGHVTRGREIFVVDGLGRKRPLEIKGYQHLAPR